MSEDSADMFGLEKNTTAVPVKAKPPYLSIHIRHETTSTESKDTLTPIEPSDIQAPDEDENGSTENIMELNFETARQKALRRRAMGRRSSETCSNYDLNRSQTSLNAILAMSRRQLSLTQSEPDSGNELLGWSSFPKHQLLDSFDSLSIIILVCYSSTFNIGPPQRSNVIPIKSNRHMLLQFHSEYTSITDELENVCHLITSPTLSINRESEKTCSNAEVAALLEKKHLQECEESDYLMLSNLFQNRDSANDSDDALADVCIVLSVYDLCLFIQNQMGRLCVSFEFRRITRLRTFRIDVYYGVKRP